MKLSLVYDRLLIILDLSWLVLFKSLLPDEEKLNVLQKIIF